MSLYKKGFNMVSNLFKKKGNHKTKMFKKGDLDLYEGFKNSYASRKDQEKFGADAGYIFDAELSNDNQQVYFNPTSQKMLYSVSGTHNLSDIGTDIQLMRGRLKDTKRYKQSQATLDKAKEKYQPESVTGYGTSLGGQIVNNLSDIDRKITLNKATPIFGKSSKGEHIRSQGDIVSIFGANAKHAQTLSGGGDLFDPKTWLNAHSSDSIKGKGFRFG